MKKTDKYFEIKQKFTSYHPAEIVSKLGFEEAILLARDMLNNDAWDESLQVKAVTLLEEIRQTFPQKWNSSWHYDALLGYGHDIVLNYDARYEAYKRAIDHGPPPPQLLVAMAGCCISPGKPPISEEEAISLIKRAINDIYYIDAVEFLIGLYKSTGNDREQTYWEAILQKIKDTGIHLPSLDMIPGEDIS